MTKPPVTSSEPILQDETSRITDILMNQIGEFEVESALTIVCNFAGQLVAAVCGGKPSSIQKYTQSLSENIRRAAITKILYDDAQARKEKKWH